MILDEVKAARFKRMLEIRQALGRAAVKKLPAFLARVQADGRARSNLMYHGAGTGRWTAKGIQLQNLPSRDLAIEAEEVEGALRAAEMGLLESLYGGAQEVATACIRGLLIAAPGTRFICADYSSIEGRVCAWMAGEETVLQSYLDKLDLYKVAASGAFRTAYELVTKAQRQVGKVIELFCQYQGSLGAVKKACINYGVKIPDEEAKAAIAAWRESRPATTALWKQLESAAMSAVQQPGTMYVYRAIRFKVIGKWLLMRLPSNRLLYYYQPEIVSKEMPWRTDNGDPVLRDVVSFYGVDSVTKHWQRQYGYGGLWAENAVQATARDLMANAMLNIEAAGYPLVLTVHDELLAEVPNGHGTVQEFEELCCQLPTWAEGLPVSAEGWEGRRYRK